MSNLYTVFEGFCMDRPTLFDGLAIYPLVSNESSISVPYITLSYKNEDERKALLVKIKSLWYGVCFLYYLEHGALNPSMKYITWYNGDTPPALSYGDAPPPLGGYLSRLKGAEGGGRLHKASKSLVWLILYLTETITVQRAIKLYNGFGQLYGDYDKIPASLLSYARDMMSMINSETPEAFTPSAKEPTAHEFQELEKLFVEEFLKQYGKYFIS